MSKLSTEDIKQRNREADQAITTDIISLQGNRELVVVTDHHRDAVVIRFRSKQVDATTIVRLEFNSDWGCRVISGPCKDGSLK